MNGVLVPWFVAALAQTVRDVKTYHRPPVPAEFVASGVLFGSLAALSSMKPSPLWGALGWGFLVAVVLRAAQEGKGQAGSILKRKVPQQQTGGKQ